MTIGTDPSTGNVSLIDDVVNAFGEEPARGRIFAMMGPNGAGKSRLLQDVKGALNQQQLPSFLLPSVRAFQNAAPMGGQYHHVSPTGYDEISQLWAAIVATMTVPPEAGGHMRPMRQPTPLPVAIQLLLQLSAQIDRETTENYKNALVEWDAGRGQRPSQPKSLVAELERHLGAILGYTVTVPRPPFGPQNDFKFQRGDVTFGLNGLSDGEKQLLLISVFLITVDLRRFVILVDEPELYLNEARAIEIWGQLETRFPSALFLYATHSVAFATRPSVERTYLVDMNRQVTPLDRREPVPPNVMRDIVGSRIQLLRSSSRQIFCEDTMNRLILADIFPESDIEPNIVSSWSAVVSAVAKEHGWKDHRSEGPKHCGVIDRDARDNDEVAGYATTGVFCFPLYESESLLLDPTVAVWLISDTSPISKEEYIDLLTECAKDRLGMTLNKIGKHLCWREKQRITFEVGEYALSSVSITTTPDLEERFQLRADALYAAIRDKDSFAILTLFNGKGLYRRMSTMLAKRFTLPDQPRQLYTQLKMVPEFSSVLARLPWLTSFKDRIKAHLG
jgi:energy-coupling factor transporter ATP-binding protein EcfA2